jgi:23S rRNA (adenine1618-N6)-methyltransferase
MHPRNPHQTRYNLKSLMKSTPELASFIIQNPLQQDAIDFTNPAAVQVLNQAILKQFYGINYWKIPQDFLCPPVPGRADYIHYFADLMENTESCKGLDIGTGANCIYPSIGHASYKWTFTASELNLKAFKNAQEIIRENHLLDFIELRLQKNPQQIFKGIIAEDEKFDFTSATLLFIPLLKKPGKAVRENGEILGRRILILTLEVSPMSYGAKVEKKLL